MSDAEVNRRSTPALRRTAGAVQTLKSRWQRHAVQAGHDVPRSLRFDVVQSDAAVVPYCAGWSARACVQPELAMCVKFTARRDGRRRTQVSARDTQKAFDMHDATPVQPGQAGQRSISDTAQRNQARRAFLHMRERAADRPRRRSVKKRANPAIRVSGRKESPASLTRDCSLIAGTGRRTRSTTRACVHEGLSFS